MNSNFKKIIAAVATASILGIAYYGTYLPLRKSQIFIDSLRNLNKATSLQAFENTMSAALDAPSPIGQEEAVRNMANVVLNVFQHGGDPKVIAELMRYIDSYYSPIIARGHGMSFEQDLYISGALNELAFAQTHDPQYLQAAGSYYLQGLKLGPKRPQSLYGLLDVYRVEGNVDGVKAVAGQILSQWPGDERTRALIAQYLANPPASTTPQGPAKKK